MFAYRSNYRAVVHRPKPVVVKRDEITTSGVSEHKRARDRIEDAGLRWGDVSRQGEELFKAAPDMTLAEFRELCADMPAKPTTIATMFYRLRAKYAPAPETVGAD